MDRLTFKHPETAGLVTIVTPVHNGRLYLQEALDGIAAQRYGSWELIVVEDGSKEDSADIVRRFAAANPGRRVTYLRNEPSGGASYSRNVAFLEARGEFIACLDCDDRWLPGHLEACVGALTSSGDDLAYSTTIMVADSDESVIGVWGPTPHDLANFPQSLFTRSFITPSATVFRRSFVGDVGPWDASYRCCEDFDFFMRGLAIGKRFRYVGGVHCLYRKDHEGAATQRLAETIEYFAMVSQIHDAIPGTRRGHRARSIATTYELAARLHTTLRLHSDPAVYPARAALLYYKAWRVRPKRWKNLVKSAYCRLRYGFDAGVQPQTRPSLPAAYLAQTSDSRAA